LACQMLDMSIGAGDENEMGCSYHLLKVQTMYNARGG
jgi:hypothetical protein